VTLISSGNIQYVNCCYTRERVVLIGDRRNREKSHPTFELWSNKNEQQATLKILDILPEAMYSSRPVERCDIYILKEGATILKEGFENIIAEFTPVITLDRSERNPRDPAYHYEEEGLPLQISSLEAWVKITSINAYFIPGNFTLQTLRINNNNNSVPRLNIDVEHAKSRLHIGIEVDWDKLDSIVGAESSIEIDIPWTECGHFLGAINGALSKLK
jgi:hypothetical protein